MFGLRKIIAVVITISVFAVPFSATAGVVDKYREEKPLDSFKRWELVMDGALFIALIALNASDEPAPGMGPPQKGSFDYDVNDDYINRDGSNALHLSDWFLGISVITPLAAYGSGILFDKPGIKYPFSKLIAFGEAGLITMTLTEASKKGIGRERPDGSETLSFFSGHSSSAFAAASFFALDINAWLRNDVLEDSSAFTRNLATAGTFAGFYSLAGLAAFYRIPAHKHFASDVIFGSVVGAAVGNLIYLTHFTLDGERRFGGDVELVEDESYRKVTFMPLAGDEFVGIGFEWRF